MSDSHFDWMAWEDAADGPTWHKHAPAWLGCCLAFLLILAMPLIVAAVVLLLKLPTR